jgi:hypothetical protein
MVLLFTLLYKLHSSVLIVPIFFKRYIGMALLKFYSSERFLREVECCYIEHG